MKKTIAMLSALAISASMVMPFSAAAEEQDPVQVQYKAVLLDTDKYKPSDYATAQAYYEAIGATKLTGDQIKAIYAAGNITGLPTDGSYEILRDWSSQNDSVFYTYKPEQGTTGNELDMDYWNYWNNYNVTFYYLVPSDTKTITQDKIPTNSATDVEYTVDPAYMVTIPANVTLSSSDVQTKTVTAENVKLDYGKEVVVKLTKAENAKGEDAAAEKVFSAVTADKTSTANYTINEGKIGIGDTVATFPTFTDATQEADKKKEIKFSAASGATFAGEHSEQLTFTLSVEASEQGGSQGESASDWKTVSIGGVSLYVKEGETWADIAAYAGNANKITIDEEESTVKVGGSTLVHDDFNNVKPDDTYSSTIHYDVGL